VLLSVTSVDAVITAAGPLILRMIIDNGSPPHQIGVVVTLALAGAGLTLAADDLYADLYRTQFARQGAGDGMARL
jgi:hypothetical protein